MKQLKACSAFPFSLNTRNRLRQMCFIWISRLTLIYVVFGTTECCFKSGSSDGDGSTPTTLSPSNGGGNGAAGYTNPPSSTTPPSAVNRLQCTDAEIISLECHNGGTCFAVKNAFGVRMLQCQCPEEWIGAKCEERNIKIILGGVQSAGVSNTVGLIIGICIGAIAMLVVGFLIGWFSRRRSELTKQKNKEDQSNGNGLVTNSTNLPPSEHANGNTYKPIQDYPETPSSYRYGDSMDVSEEASLAGQPDTFGATRGYTARR